MMVEQKKQECGCNWALFRGRCLAQRHYVPLIETNPNMSLIRTGALTPESIMNVELGYHRQLQYLY